MKLDRESTGPITEHLVSVFFGHGQNVAVFRWFQYALAVKNAGRKIFRKIVQQKIAFACLCQFDIGKAGFTSGRIVADDTAKGMCHELMAVTDPESGMSKGMAFRIHSAILSLHSSLSVTMLHEPVMMAAVTDTGSGSFSPR